VCWNSFCFHAFYSEGSVNCSASQGAQVPFHFGTSPFVHGSSPASPIDNGQRAALISAASRVTSRLTSLSLVFHHVPWASTRPVPSFVLTSHSFRLRDRGMIQYLSKEHLMLEYDSSPNIFFALGVLECARRPLKANDIICAFSNVSACACPTPFHLQHIVIAFVPSIRTHIAWPSVTRGAFIFVRHFSHLTSCRPRVPARRVASSFPLACNLSLREQRTNSGNPWYEREKLSLRWHANRYDEKL